MLALLLQPDGHAEPGEAGADDRDAVVGHVNLRSPGQEQLDDPVRQLLDGNVGVVPHPVGHALVGGVDGVRGHLELARVHVLRGAISAHQLADQGGLAPADAHSGVGEATLVEKLLGDAVLGGEAEEGEPAGAQAAASGSSCARTRGVGDLLREPQCEAFEAGLKRPSLRCRTARR